jgi:hypothetical protein
MADPLYYSTRMHDRSGGGGGGGTFMDEGGLNQKKVCSSETSCFKGKNFLGSLNVYEFGLWRH